MLPKHTKKLILLLDNKNPLWFKKLGRLLDKAMAEIFDVKDTTISNWRSGKKGVSKDILNKAVANLFEHIQKKSQLPPIIENESCIFVEKIFDDDEGVYEFSHSLGYTTTECQKIIDRRVFKSQGLFSQLFYDPTNKGRALAETHVDKLGGYYRVYVDRGDHVLHCPLRLRYHLKLCRRQVIRVKMNLPTYTGSPGKDQGYHEYDGFVSIKSRNMFWIFEERARDISDFFQMITERPDIAAVRGAPEGKYLTAKRDRESTILAGDMFMVHIDPSGDRREKFMHEEPVVISDKSYKELRVENGLPKQAT